MTPVAGEEDRKRNGKKSTGENSKKSSGDGTPKLQISVPCRSRTRPEINEF